MSSDPDSLAVVSGCMGESKASFTNFISSFIFHYSHSRCHSQASMTIASIKVPYGLLEMILHRNGTTEMVEPEPICEDYSDCEDTVELPPEPEQTSSAPREIFLELNLSFEPVFAGLSHLLSSSYANQPSHRGEHWSTNWEYWNNHWRNHWENHWRNHWRNKYVHDWNMHHQWNRPYPNSRY